MATKKKSDGIPPSKIYEQAIEFLFNQWELGNVSSEHVMMRLDIIRNAVMDSYNTYRMGTEDYYILMDMTLEIEAFIESQPA